MTFDEKCSAALKLLESKGFSHAHYSPGVYRWLWRAGVPILPPHFAGFFYNWLVLGSLFALTCYIVSFIMWLFSAASQESIDFSHLPYLAAYGALFGFAMSAVYRFGARRHAIPRWGEFQPNQKFEQTGTPP